MKVVFQIGQTVHCHVAVLAVPGFQKRTVQVRFLRCQYRGISGILFSPDFPFRGGTDIIQIFVHDHDCGVKSLIDALTVHGDLRLQFLFLFHSDLTALRQKQTGEKQRRETHRQQSERNYGIPHGKGDAGHLKQDKSGNEASYADTQEQPEPQLPAFSAFGLFSDVAFPDPYIAVSGKESRHMAGRLDHVGRGFLQPVADILFVILIQQSVQFCDHGILRFLRGACRRHRLQQTVPVVFPKMKHCLHPNTSSLRVSIIYINYIRSF